MTKPDFPFGPDTPLRLATAAKLAFPDGSMTAKGLRREADRSRLVIERVAGKDYTTINDIKRMRELCRLKPKAQDSTSDHGARTLVSSGKGHGSSATTEILKNSQAAARMIVEELKNNSLSTSQQNT